LPKENRRAARSAKRKSKRGPNNFMILRRRHAGAQSVYLAARIACGQREQPRNPREPTFPFAGSGTPRLWELLFHAR
jgi:hypothetical protein